MVGLVEVFLRERVANALIDLAMDGMIGQSLCIIKVDVAKNGLAFGTMQKAAGA